MFALNLQFYGMTIFSIYECIANSKISLPFNILWDLVCIFVPVIKEGKQNKQQIQTKMNLLLHLIFQLAPSHLHLSLQRKGLFN